VALGLTQQVIAVLFGHSGSDAIIHHGRDPHADLSTSGAGWAQPLLVMPLAHRLGAWVVGWGRDFWVVGLAMRAGWTHGRGPASGLATERPRIGH
jgi:hypothetical protein